MVLFRQLMDMSFREISIHLRRKLKRSSCLTSFSEKNPCVFVLSTGRVGSMTLAALLSKSSNILVCHEPKPYLFSVSRANYMYGKNISIDFWFHLWECLRGEHLNYALNYGLGYVETSPQGTFLAPIIASIVPHVRFIHLVRNPFDVVRSGISRNWFNGHIADMHRIVPTKNNIYSARWSKMSVIEKNLWLWYETNRWIIDQLNNFPDVRNIRICAEDMFRGDQRTLDVLANFCGVNSLDKKHVQKILARRLNQQPILVNSTFDSWGQSEKKLARDILPNLMREIGYEKFNYSYL